MRTPLSPRGASRGELREKQKEICILFKTQDQPNRDSSAHMQPEIYEAAEHTILKGSTANDTHWTLTTLCKGCSTWIHNGGAKEVLDPGAQAASFAFAASALPPADPTDSFSPIDIHSEHGIFTLDLAAAKADEFDSLIEQLSN